ncbi:MAG TPA: outer membrane beta-barrel protein [Candidatus Eisenbacteria bacterium]|nr:outer membrane beta-barrel protein [Candidatus Eisenbacteria bacterium]
MSRTRMAVLAAVAVMAFAAAPAMAMTIGGEVFGSFDTHAMSDWKDVTDDINALGGEIDEPTSSWGGGLGLRMWPNSTWMIAATWEPIFLTREEEVTGDELKLDANSFQGTVGYFFPTTGTAKYGLGAGVGYYTLNGEFGDGGPELTGSTVGFHFLGMGEWTVSPGFAITGSAGYRIANIADTKADDVSADPEFETDYSGFMVRAGLAFYMPGASGQ